MVDLSWYAGRPWTFFGRYLRRRPLAHGFILVAVLLAVACATSTQYGVKALVDALSAGRDADKVGGALVLLLVLIGADNLLWRVAAVVAAVTFVRVTGDLRMDLFQHLTGHAPAYFADRQPGTVASRVTATSNAFYLMENMFVWNVLPPCAAAVCSIAFIATVNLTMALSMAAVCFVMIVVMFRLAAAGKPLHHDFADKAASVDGEMVDLIGNMSLVKSFGGLGREFTRFGGTLDREMKARRKSLFYLERLRIIHAIVTIIATVALLYWAVGLWQRNEVSPGQVILVATLGLAILHSTRDLAVALVDVTQHTARLSEAIGNILTPHQLRDVPEASELVPQGAAVEFHDVSFAYPDGKEICNGLSFRIEAGQWVGLVGESGGGKSTLFALLQRFYDLQGGRILIDGQDISKVTQESLRKSMTVVPQDISLFHRTLLENIRYARPDASDADVRAAADAARCSGFIADLPHGYDTIVGDRGVKLSGGQRQRIAIARALLKNSPIVLLDEATSALDTQSEAEVRAALENLMRHRTVIAIAHRMTTLRTFDRILQFAKGQIVRDDAAEKFFWTDGPSGERVQAGEGALAPAA